MKEQHANSGQVFYADYVVPVYNLNKDAHYSMQRAYQLGIAY